MSLCLSHMLTSLSYSQHKEQLQMPFIHHQLIGQSHWYLIPYSEHKNLNQLIYKMVKVNSFWLKRQQGQVEFLDHEFTKSLYLIPFYSKNLFPPESLLKEYGIKYYKIELQPGQILMAHGGFAHYGYS